MGERTSPPEEGVATPGIVAVVDDRGRLRDRSPRAAEDPFVGAVELGQVFPVTEVIGARRRLLDGSPFEAFWLARGQREIGSGLAEREFATMLYRLRNQLGVVLSAMETAELVGDGPVSSRLGTTQRREVERLVDGAHALGFAFGPAGGGVCSTSTSWCAAPSTPRGAGRVGARSRSASRSAPRRVGRSRATPRCCRPAWTPSSPTPSTRAPTARRSACRSSPVPPRCCSRSPTTALELLVPEVGRPDAPFATTRKGALGVGLSVAQRAAAVHLGELVVATRAEGRGTAARLWLPVPP